MLDRRIGGDKFGQLGLIKGHGGCLSASEGKLDNIMNVSKKIDVEDVLKHNDDNSPIKVVVDGPPGVGKTTLCKKLCNMWAKNELKKCCFDHVFLLPLRDDRVTSAEGIYDLVSLFHSDKVICEAVSQQIKKTNGKCLLLIFDGWDEFEERNKDRSFILDIIRGKHPLRCNIMVTSRTYASANLLEIQTVDRHIEVLGFEKSEIISYIKKELTEEKSEQLVMELVIREDVLSICYIPFLCSMLVRVYHMFDYTLPNTLTELYQKFIIYAMKRSTNRPGFNPRRIESLDNLQEDQKAFDELCYCAYVNLQKTSTNFTEDQIQSYKCKHFGLMNFYTIADTTQYQFIHLTIQEFLAAWWISQQNDQKKLFGEHFQDIQFRMTLKFVAGLTGLKDDSYQEYFSKEVDLQCVRKPLFGFESHQCSLFHQSPQMLQKCISEGELNEEYPLHERYDTDTIQLFHLIYESQNKKLCQIFASSIKNPSLCVDRVISSQFDLLCLSFFLKNSKKTWNYLHLGNIDKHMIFDNNNDCYIMKAGYWSITSVIKIHQSSLCKYLQESYISIFNPSDVTHLLSMFTDLFKLPHLNILHVAFSLFSNKSENYDGKEILEKVISTNHNIKELFISFYNIPQCSTLINSIFAGVKRNNTIHFFSLSYNPSVNINSTISSLQVEELLKNNQTLQAVKLNIPIKGILPSLCIASGNESLTALNISRDTVHDMMTYPAENTETLSSGLENVGRNISNLKSLSLYKPLMPFIIYLDSNPFLQQLDIVLEREESLGELFNILSSNTTIIALRIKYYGLFHDEVGKSFEMMLSSNQTLQCLEIQQLVLPVKYLTVGLRENSTLQELDIYFTLSENVKEFFEASNNLKSLAVSFIKSELWKHSDETFMSWYDEEIIPQVTNMLKRNEDVMFLKVDFFYRLSNRVTVKDDWIPMVHQFWEAVLLHPSLCYIYVHISNQLMRDVLNGKKKTLITQREEKNLGPPPLVETMNI